MDNSAKPRLSAATWHKSPYLLLLPIVAGLIIWLLCWSDRHFVSDNQVEETVITLSAPLQEYSSGLPDSLAFPAGTQLSMLGHFDNAILVEDTAGRRFRIFLKPSDYTVAIPGNADKRHFDTHYYFYVKASDPEQVLVGKNINDIIKKYGDYTYGDPSAGYYGFRYLTPLVDGVRYESGVALLTDSDGNVISSRILKPEYSSSNFFHILPFYDTITSWNLARGFHSLFRDKSPEPEHESKGFFGTIFGWIWGIIVWLFKLVILIVLLGAIFIVPPMAIAAITGPLIHFKHISSGTIDLINLVFSIPLEYIIFITLTDYFHQLWLVAMPFFALCAIAAIWMPSQLTTGRRCPKCRAVDTLKSTTTKLDERVRYEYEYRVHESDKLKYKGYNLRRGQDEWAQKVTYSRVRYKITETDYRRDWVCTACGASGTSYSTDKKRKFDGVVESETHNRLWKEK